MKPAVSTNAAIFVLGLALGAVGGSWGQRMAFHRAMMNGPKHRRMMLERLTRDLGLNDAQKAAVSATFDSKKADIDKLKADTFARMTAIRQSADAELAKVLTQEQFAKLQEQHRARPMRINWDSPEAEAPAR